MIIPVILAGGSGSRLWPASTPQRPKQFLRLLSKHTLFQETMLRAVKIGLTPMVVCPAEHVRTVQNQLNEIAVGATILVEPAARNTAPAIIAASMIASRYREDPTICVMPCDHSIGDTEALLVAIRQAVRTRSLIKLIGVQPTHPSADYGYIVPKSTGFVADFVEKPIDPNDQTELIVKGALWNSGIFVGKTQHFLKVALHCVPELYQQVVEAVEYTKQTERVHLLGGKYAECAPLQFDRAILEKIADYCSVTKLEAPWSDVGTWPALIQAAEGKEGGEFAVRGRSVSSGPRVEILTSHPVTVIATADHVLVTDEGNMHRIPEVAVLNPSHEEPRPWGSFSVVATDPAGAWKIKRLRINPQSAISLQTHSNRAETWLVLSGSARVTHDNRVLQLEENETIHIPVGTRHRVENTTRKMLEILEIQTGTSFGEDDIRRFDDIYGRVL